MFTITFLLKQISYKKYISKAKTSIDENIDSVYTWFDNKSLKYEFGTLREELVRDLLICGLHFKNWNLQEKRLHKSELTLYKAINICKTS